MTLARAFAPTPNPLAVVAPPIDATPLDQPLTLYQGDDFYLTLTVTDPGTGAASDLTGAVATAEIRTTPSDTTVMAAFTASIAGNVVSLHLPHTEAAKLAATGGVWDCQIDVTGEVTTLAFGKVTVIAEVTRP